MGPAPKPTRPRELRLFWLYTYAILREFRWTLLALFAALCLGTLLCRLVLPGPPRLHAALYLTWMTLLGQPAAEAAESAPLALLFALYPLLGFVLIGEGIVRLSLLLFSKRHARKEWMRVMASTYRDHVVLCGLGHLGHRVLEELVSASVPTVVIEKDESARAITDARNLGVPVLLLDMKDDQALIDAGVPHARAIIICTNDDMANLEVALDARRLNRNIRVVMRLFEQQIASKIAGALMVDAAFSSSALAAPMVAALSLETKVHASTVINGIPHITCEVTVQPQSALANRRVDELERGYSMRLLAITHATGPTESPPSAATTIAPGDTLFLHAAAIQLSTLSAAAAPKGTAAVHTD